LNLPSRGLHDRTGIEGLCPPILPVPDAACSAIVGDLRSREITSGRYQDRYQVDRDDDRLTSAAPAGTSRGSRSLRAWAAWCWTCLLGREGSLRAWRDRRPDGRRLSSGASVRSRAGGLCEATLEPASSARRGELEGVHLAGERAVVAGAPHLKARVTGAGVRVVAGVQLGL
jgi:hypothetical protein